MQTSLLTNKVTYGYFENLMMSTRGKITSKPFVLISKILKIRLCGLNFSNSMGDLSKTNKNKGNTNND